MPTSDHVTVLEGAGRAAPRSVTRDLLVGVRLTVSLLIVCAGVYPLALYVGAHVAFAYQAEGSLIRDASGRVIGSEIIGQAFTRAEYFHSRPSAVAYNAAASGGSNLEPTNPDLLGGRGGVHAGVVANAAAFRRENGLAPTTPLPPDAVTASGSGLDPHISPASAELRRCPPTSR